MYPVLHPTPRQATVLSSFQACSGVVFAELQNSSSVFIIIDKSNFSENVALSLSQAAREVTQEGILGLAVLAPWHSWRVVPNPRRRCYERSLSLIHI